MRRFHAFDTISRPARSIWHVIAASTMGRATGVHAIPIEPLSEADAALRDR
jgi:hypothetical protein